MHDFGSSAENQKHYGSDTPPLYDLGAFYPKVAIFSGTNDYLADPVDVQKLYNELPANKIVFRNNQVRVMTCSFLFSNLLYF
jgi:hypothetical protein